MQEMNCYVYPALATVPVVALTFRGSKAVVHAMYNYFQFTLRCMVCLLQHMKRNYEKEHMKRSACMQPIPSVLNVWIHMYF